MVSPRVKGGPDGPDVARIEFTLSGPRYARFARDYFG